MVKSTTTTNAETAGPQDLPAGWMHTNSPKPKPKVTPVSSPAVDDGGADQAKANVQAGRCHNCGHTGHWAKDCTIIFSKMIADRDSACALCAFPVKGKKDMIVKLACGPTSATNGSTAPAPCRTWSRSVRSERAPRAPQLHESSRWEQHRVWLCQDPYACVLRPCMKESFKNTVPNHTFPLSCTQTPMQHLRRPARPSGEPRRMRHALRCLAQLQQKFCQLSTKDASFSNDEDLDDQRRCSMPPCFGAGGTAACCKLNLSPGLLGGGFEQGLCT